MPKLKIFLTGGSGFLGKNILEILGAKYEFLSPDEDALDLLDTEAVLNFMKINQPDLVIHAATVGGNRNTNNLPGILQKNLLMYFNLLNTEAYFKRMIVFGSGAEYDKRKDLHLISEECFGRSIPVDEYGLAKFVMAKIAENNHKITHLRFFGIFGKYEDYETRFISNAICRKILGLPIVIKKNVYFDYIFIKDLVKILERFITVKPASICYNIGRGQTIDLLSLANIINEYGGNKTDIKIIENGLNREYSGDIKKFMNEFGPIDYTDFREAIAEMFAYYEKICQKLDINKFFI
ncbi:MAG: NAD(P)-dependent oxidoreductase [Patescibacteria group bacterium]|nr:NAD(P)-dependent oxidoreductase [Patescibacteria group bacterium]